MRKWNEMFHEILLGRLQVFTKTGRRQLEDCPEASFAVASWHLVDICTRLISKLRFFSLQIYSTPNLNLYGANIVFFIKEGGQPLHCGESWNSGTKIANRQFISPWILTSFIRLAAGFDVEDTCLRIKFYARDSIVWVCVHSHNNICQQICLFILNVCFAFACCWIGEIKTITKLTKLC